MRPGSTQDAASVLRDGGVIAYPTEAVFGLGCDPRNQDALERIIRIKGREAHKGFILIGGDLQHVIPYLAPITAQWRQQIDTLWPGPVTLVIPCATDTPELLSGGRDTLAVRVSDHPEVRQLCDDFDGAIVSTSANRSGQEPCRDSAAVIRTFGEELDAIIDAPVGTLDKPTRIIDVRSGKRLR